jgi:hypothetical protein
MGDGAILMRATPWCSMDKAVISLCFLERPVDFGALDGKPVQALFTLIRQRARPPTLLSRLSFSCRTSDSKSW